MRFFLLLLFFSFSSLSQKLSEGFIEVSFQKGLPTGIEFNWQHCLYSSINSGNYFKSISIVSQDSLETPDKCFLFCKNGLSSLTTTPISFEKVEDNIYQTTIDLVTQEEDNLSPLKLILNVKEKLLKYRWNNRKENDYKNPMIIKEYPLKIGKLLPLISVETINGRWTTKNKSKIIAINWWATSCVPCVEEIHGLNELVTKYSKDKVEFIAILSDKKNFPKFIKNHKFDYQQCFGNKEMENLFGGSFPRNIIINKNGVIIYNKTGGSKDTYIELNKIIKEYLKQ